ncbi:MAG: alpha/beta fold hydrolase [Blastocatellia bacterium]|nr:alpha/beta fold hydrolase [Blastocatellia bacterium]
MAAEPQLIIRPKPNPEARLRLFCFPYAGGGAPAFHSWAAQLPEDVEQCTIQLPGRGSRVFEPPYQRVSPLVEMLAEKLLPWFDRPCAFFGHSMGGLVAFELANRLRQQGSRCDLRHLVVSGRCAPDWTARDFTMYTLSDKEFVEKLKEFNGTPKEVFDHPELLELLLPTIRADFEVCETYRAKGDEQVTCPLTVFGSDGDPDVPPEALEGWSRFSTAPVRIRMFVGDHFFIHSRQTEVLLELFGILETCHG